MLLSLSIAPGADSHALLISFWRSTGDAVKPADLKVTLNGTDAKVLRLSSPADDQMLLVVLDLAGDLSLVDPAKAALIAGVSALPANTSVGLLRAQDGLRVLADPGTRRDRLAEIIDGLTVSGRAGLLDTLQPMVRLTDSILAKAPIRLSVLYITDSSIGNYREDYTNPVVNSSDTNDMSRRFPEGLVNEKIQSLKKEIAGVLAPIFIVHLHYQNGRLASAYQTGLLDLATESGGAAEFCRSVSDIPVTVAGMMAAITTQQTAEVSWKDSARARQLEIFLEAEDRTLHYRQRIPLKPRQSH
ncbi:MAG: hypothetical protein ABJF23_00940 [Bryobacteraceae bacterium]